jgi:DNA (cytosine-5)-methyltransferase 1
VRLVGFPRRSDGAAEVILDGTAYRARDLRPETMLSFVVTSKARSWNVYDTDGGRRQLTVGEIGALQGFPLNYPWHGKRTPAVLQIANAVPPPMAAGLLSTLID